MQQASLLAPLQWSGIAWMQGEEDSKYVGMALAYENNLTATLNCIKKDVH